MCWHMHLYTNEQTWCRCAGVGVCFLPCIFLPSIVAANYVSVAIQWSTCVVYTLPMLLTQSPPHTPHTQSMSREALQAALLEAYATMDAMETQLTTLEQQLGMKYTDTPPRRVFATRSSCTQPLQPLPPPPLPLYTASTMSSQPLPTVRFVCFLNRFHHMFVP